MASTMFYMSLCLLSFALPFPRAAATPWSSNISLESSIRPNANPTAWFSPSGRFAFGFYSEGHGFYVGVWLQNKSPGDKTVIWTARLDDGPLPADAKVKFTIGGLVLLRNGSEDRSLTDPSSFSDAFSASMLDTCNFVVYDASSRILWDWKTDSSPTDTIVSGQVLFYGSGLVSSTSRSNHSSGRFRLKMQSDGNLVMYPVNTTDTGDDAYWSSETNGLPYSSLNLDTDGNLYLLENNGSTHNLTGNKLRRSVLFYRATLDADGIFRLHSHDLESYYTKVLAEFPPSTDLCTIKGTCGSNSYCTQIGEQPACSCLPGFDFVDADLNWNGCKQSFVDDAACPSKNDDVVYNMQKLEKLEWLNDPYYRSTTQDIDSCSEECLNDCSCVAALFEVNECSLQKFPMRYGRRDSNDQTVTFVKVRTAKPNGSSVRSHGDGTAAEPVRKEQPIKILVSVAALTSFFSVMLVLCFFLYRHRARRSYGRMLTRNRELDLVDEIALRSFSFQELRDATGDFKEVLGKGAFGTVFKGVFPNSGMAIAIKKLEQVTGEGEREFRTEMRAIARTHHKNLVRLIGFCDEGQHRLLVYEYMSNGSLADLIFNAGRWPDWSDRVRITLDIAKGIQYLHEGCEASIIHCDIKPHNILMDEAWTAKISDFGLAKLLMPSQSRTFTEIRGTRGYLAPEWHKNAPITVKADVYSFGIVLLEIVCCRRNMELEAGVDEIMLLDWVHSCFVAGELEKVVPDEVDMTELSRFVKVGLWCAIPEPAHRPTMKNVVMMLEGNIDVSLPPPLASSY